MLRQNKIINIYRFIIRNFNDKAVFFCIYSFLLSDFFSSYQNYVCDMA